MKTKLSGRVFTGHGEGRKYMELPWVKREMEEKLGFTPCAGTLDLRLDEESVARRKQLDEKYALGVCTAEGYCRGLLFKASIAGLACGIVLPQVDNYPDGLLEVVAPVNLRQKLGLHDGDTVEVTVFL